MLTAYDLRFVIHFVRFTEAFLCNTYIIFFQLEPVDEYFYESLKESQMRSKLVLDRGTRQFCEEPFSLNLQDRSSSEYDPELVFGFIFL